MKKQLTLSLHYKQDCENFAARTNKVLSSATYTIIYPNVSRDIIVAQHKVEIPIFLPFHDFLGFHSEVGDKNPLGAKTIAVFEQNYRPPNKVNIYHLKHKCYKLGIDSNEQEKLILSIQGYNNSNVIDLLQCSNNYNVYMRFDDKNIAKFNYRKQSNTFIQKNYQDFNGFRMSSDKKHLIKADCDQPLSMLSIEILNLHNYSKYSLRSTEYPFEKMSIVRDNLHSKRSSDYYSTLEIKDMVGNAYCWYWSKEFFERFGSAAPKVLSIKHNIKFTNLGVPRDTVLLHGRENLIIMQIDQFNKTLIVSKKSLSWDNADSAYIFLMKDSFDIIYREKEDVNNFMPVKSLLKGNLPDEDDDINIDHINPYFGKYTLDALDNLLKLRLDDSDVNFDINIFQAYFLDESHNNINTVLDILYNTNQTTFIPLNLFNKHAAGLIFERSNDNILQIKYIDPENNPIPSKLLEIITQQLPNTQYEQLQVERQKYSNCGPEVIENFILYLTGQRVSQEKAIELHSKLVENQLLGIEQPKTYKLFEDEIYQNELYPTIEDSLIVEDAMSHNTEINTLPMAELIGEV